MIRPPRHLVMGIGAAGPMLAALAAAAQTAEPPATQLAPIGVTGIESIEVGPSATGDRAPAKENKKEAPNFIEVQPHDEIIKLPDVNIAEALQRVPGISLETDSGEGRFINIRGLDADLNGTTYDGVRLPPTNQSSPFGGSRAVAFDVFPAGSIGGIEVIKTLTPDLDAEGLGGVINLVPRQMPADRNALLELTLGGGIEPLRSSPIVKGDFVAGVNFGLGAGAAPWDPLGGEAPGRFSNPRPFSVMAYYSRYDDARGLDDVEEDYSDTPGFPDKTLSDLQLRRYEYHRSRAGGGGEIDFKPDDDNSFYIRAFDTGYEERAEKHYIVFNGLDAGGDPTSFATNPDGSFTVSNGNVTAREQFTNSDERLESLLVAAGGHHVLGDGVKIDYRAAWVRGTDNFDSGYSIRFKGPTIDSFTYNNLNPNAITFSAPAVAVNDPSLYALNPGGASNSPSKASDREWSGALDVTVPLSFGAVDGALKVGVSGRFRERKTSQNGVTLSPAGDPIPLAGLTTGGDQVYYDGLYNLGPTLDNGAFLKLPLVQQGPVDLPGSDAYNDLISNLEAFQDDTENVYGGYAMYTATIGKLTLLAGVRVEQTDAVYKANTGTTEADGVTVDITPSSLKQNYTDVFPTLQAKYQIADDLQARLAISTGIARPGFEQITAARTVDLSQFTVSQGNPDLKPTTGVDYDLALEYYLPKGGIAAINVFDKEFDNYIVTTGYFGQATFSNVAAIYQFSSYKNIGSAFVRGIELAYTQQFDFLPEPFDGFGFDGNLTYNYSQGEIRPGEFEPLPSTSARNFNAAIFYEKGPWSIRVASSYVSRNIFQVGGSRATDIFSSPRFRLDWGSSYRVNDQVTLAFDAKNLTDTPLEFTESQVASRPIQREFYGQSYLFEIRVKL